MPTKKGKSKPAKLKKASNKSRRTRAAGGTGQSARAGGARGTGASRTAGGRKKDAGRLRKTEAGSVFIGTTPVPPGRLAEDRGNKKAGDGGSGKVVIL